MEQPEFIRFVLDALDQVRVEYAVVGSFASIVFGEPRFTNDVDILIRIDDSKISEFCSQFPTPDWHVSEAAAQDAVRRRKQFNVIHTLSGNKADFMVAGDSEWYDLQFERRQEVPLLPNRTGFAVHPEDIILGKLKFYRDGGSEKHLRDIAGILSVSESQVDRDRVTHWAEILNVNHEWQAVCEFIQIDRGDS